MNILVLHAHTANRGDEAAVKAMCDELIEKYPDIKIYISLNGITEYPNMPSQVKMINRFPKVKDKLAFLDYILSIVTNGKVAFSKSGKEFLQILKNADLVIHAPGGPSVGDIYYKVEYLYLMNLNLVRKNNKMYLFYAPSMGPFNIKNRTRIRRIILDGAKYVMVRDPISLKYVQEFAPECKPFQTLDSALQNEINYEENVKKLIKYSELNKFINTHKKCIGVTITELKWHPKFKNDNHMQNIIKDTFMAFIRKRIDEGYGVIFIPQLYGTANDELEMSNYMINQDTFMITSRNDEIDSYFQQFLISKLYAVVGMRYHSNIFSAKMSTPFVSIAYEQKMKGFMSSIENDENCIDIEKLNFDILEEKFQHLINHYDLYKNKLTNLHDWMKLESHRSTDAVISLIDKYLI